MMLEHLGESEAAAAIVQAIEDVLSERTLRTRDLGGNAGTENAGKAVAEAARLSQAQERTQLLTATCGGHSEKDTYDEKLQDRSHPGDGIGKEVIAAGVEVLQALAERDGGFELRFRDLRLGLGLLQTHGS